MEGRAWEGDEGRRLGSAGPRSLSTPAHVPKSETQVEGREHIPHRSQKFESSKETQNSCSKTSASLSLLRGFPFGSLSASPGFVTSSRVEADRQPCEARPPVQFRRATPSSPEKSRQCACSTRHHANARLASADATQPPAASASGSAFLGTTDMVLPETPVLGLHSKSEPLLTNKAPFY